MDLRNFLYSCDCSEKTQKKPRHDNQQGVSNMRRKTHLDGYFAPHIAFSHVAGKNSCDLIDP
jgi:hypothetical protein